MVSFLSFFLSIPLSSPGNGFPEAKSSIGRIMSGQHPQAFGTCNLGGKANHSISSSRIKRKDESKEATRQRGKGVRGCI